MNESQSASPGDTAPVPWANGVYSARRDGVTLANCDSEPVHTPGCIQAHGAMLVVRLADLRILQASENSGALLGTDAAGLIGRPAALVIGPTGEARLRDMLAHESIERNALHAFTLPAQAGSESLDATFHAVDGVGVLEFEPTGNETGQQDPDFLSRVKVAVQSLQASTGLADFCQHVTSEVRALTGLDRVMVYRFHADLHGEVFAECRRADLSPWLGLHYPEADIPRPAREIFRRIWIRPLPHAAGTLVELVPLANPDTGRPLDMTHCALRGASVMYTEYLANMGVAASLTMSIRRDGVLWGLIACHHYTPIRLPQQMRTACEFFAQVVSLQLRSAEQNEQLAYRLRLEGVHQKVVARAALAGDLMAMVDGDPSLLDAMDAGGAALRHRDRWWCVGKTPAVADLDALADWLVANHALDTPGQPVFATDALASRYPAGAALSATASGVLVVPLSRQQRDFMMWFRPEVINAVNWAGDPADKPFVTGPKGPRLTPRRSFELFVELVHQRSQPWLAVEIEAALHLRMLVMELVVSRAERINELNADLTRSNDELDAFAYVASHDLKEPLRGIHKLAHQLVESAELHDAENRRRLDALMQLTVRMDSLLDSLLHFSRVGRTNLALESVDLNEVVQEAREMIGASRSDCAASFVMPRPLPAWHCDRVRVREIFSNLLGNALKYTLKAAPRIELGYLAPAEAGPRLAAPAGSAGHTHFYVKDDGIGIEPRHFDHVIRLFKRLHARDQFGGGVGAGLTIVQKLVQRHGGALWMESAPGTGTTFWFTLPCGEQQAP